MVLHPFLSRSKKEKERKKKKRRKKGMLWVGFGSGPNTTWTFQLCISIYIGLIAGVDCELRLLIWGVNMGPRLRKHQKFRMIACSLWSRIAPAGSMANRTGPPNFCYDLWDPRDLH